MGISSLPEQCRGKGLIFYLPPWKLAVSDEKFNVEAASPNVKAFLATDEQHLLDEGLGLRLQSVEPGDVDAEFYVADFQAIARVNPDYFGKSRDIDHRFGFCNELRGA